MYVGSRLSSLDDVEFTFLQQLGIRYVRFDQWPITMSEPGSRGVLKADQVRRIQEMVKPYGLQLAIFLLPQGRDTQSWHARFGRSAEADAEIDNVCETIRVLGGAEVPVCEWTWSVPDVFGRIAWPTNTGRGGARVSRFDYDLIADKRPEYAVDMNAEQMWDNLIYFMEKILPVAEQAGVRMAMHHHDPPTQWLGGEARILSSFEGMKRMIEEVDSPMNGFNICQGTVAEQAGTDVLELIRYFGERDRVNHVHFRNVKGSVPVFDESFIDDGDVDMYQAMKIYRETGYQHLFMSDHCPRMVEVDGHPTALASRAYAVGNIRALVHAVETEYAAEKARMAQREGKLVG